MKSFQYYNQTHFEHLTGVSAEANLFKFDKFLGVYCIFPDFLRKRWS